MENLLTDDFYIDIAMLGDKIDALIIDNPALAEETKELREKIGTALQLNADYYNATDKDEKDEFGFKYSELVTEIEDDVNQLVEQLKQ